jgi:predicted transcriptional regulator
MSAHPDAMTEQISLRLPPEVLDRLRDVAERDRRPCATVARLVIEDWIKAGCPDLRRQQQQQQHEVAA